MMRMVNENDEDAPIISIGGVSLWKRKKATGKDKGSRDNGPAPAGPMHA